ncbi:MAG: molybdenum cofactor biosynthesis protein MoaE [Armatimonadetes bacterium]|nr:molybdenum cofactor biosynthesis protein MoaE [Armatimonadota bacterium]MDW8027032.1 molybdenum cofactor biosynthesis protein MoaE [Armatimonadota bacterium]
MSTEMIKVRIRFLGPAKDFSGCDEVAINLPKGSSVSTAIEELVQIFPALKNALPNYRFAVNAEYVEKENLLVDGDELAIIPPVSGGIVETDETIFVKLTDEPIDVSNLLSFVASPQSGAIVTFLGTVREFSHGKRVLALTYEAYEPMATKELMRIAEEMKRKWQICKVAIVHRVGTLSIGDVSVAIVVSAPHRSDAFAAARHAIERIKEIVPIWKREHFADGTSQWVGEKSN